MNSQGQTGIIGFFFLILVFMILWFVWLGSWLNEIGEMVVTTNNLTGIEAFAFSNLNLMVFIGLALGILAYTYFFTGK